VESSHNSLSLEGPAILHGANDLPLMNTVGLILNPLTVVW